MAMRSRSLDIDADAKRLDEAIECVLKVVRFQPPEMKDPEDGALLEAATAKNISNAKK